MEKDIHSGQLALLSLLDMSVAFDTVEHNMLIQRRSHSFGIKDRALSWLESYINGRTQPVHLSKEETNRETSAHKNTGRARTKRIIHQRTLSPWSDGCMYNDYL